MFHNYYLMSAFHLVKSLLPFWDGHCLENKKEILSLICSVENSIFDKVFAFSHPF